MFVCQYQAVQRTKIKSLKRTLFVKLSVTYLTQGLFDNFSAPCLIQVQIILLKPERHLSLHGYRYQYLVPSSSIPALSDGYKKGNTVFPVRLPTCHDRVSRHRSLRCLPTLNPISGWDFRTYLPD